MTHNNSTSFIRVTTIAISIALFVITTVTAVHASEGSKMFDEDGVQMLHATAPKGTNIRLGAQDPNKTPQFGFDYKARATSELENGLQFWRIPSTAFNYSSGPAGMTARFHMQASGEKQRFSWKTQQGYLSSPADIKNQEFTVYLRVHELIYPQTAVAALKIRGGVHTARNPDFASCSMMTLSPKGSRRITQFGKELTHPLYDYVKLAPAFDASLVDNVWIGLKLLSWTDPQDLSRVINQLHVDTTPFDAVGKPANNWRLLSEYIDIEGKSTGHYTKLVNWAGWQTTLRVDGYRSVDFAYPSVRDIVVD
jgi:hypothetical protein